MHGNRSRDDNDVLDARTAETLSARLRETRLLRRLTLKSLADAAGCSESLLSKIENAKALPSLPTLHRLVQCLDISMGRMFDAAAVRCSVAFRAGERPRTRLRVGMSSVEIERVALEDEPMFLQCGIYHLDPGMTSTGPNSHAGEETGYVISGQLELVVDGLPHRLAQGDAFAFRSERPHSFRNPGVDPASVFWVSTPPMV